MMVYDGTSVGRVRLRSPQVAYQLCVFVIEFVIPYTANTTTKIAMAIILFAIDTLNVFGSAGADGL